MRTRKIKEIVTHNPEGTLKWGARLAAQLREGDIICLSGDLGAGKTTLVKGIARGLKIKEVQVNSPTFILMNSYQGRLPLYHFDLYRIDGPKDILNIGYEEFLYSDGVSVVEWADKLGSLFPDDCVKIQLSMRGENERRLKVSSRGKRSRQIFERIKT